MMRQRGRGGPGGRGAVGGEEEYDEKGAPHGQGK